MQCRLCGSHDLHHYFSQGHIGQFAYYRCRVCKLVNYDLEGGLDQSQYEAEIIDIDDDSHPSNRANDQSYDFLRRNIGIHGSLMEIGCGSGRILKRALEDGWQVGALELSQRLAQSVRVRLGVDVRVANFLEADLGSRRYDVVILRHVLEHLPDSVEAMKRIHSLLNPGGYALLEFPNIEALDKRFKRFLEKAGLKKPRHYSEDFLPGHCNEFCRESFLFLSEKTRFELVRWETYSLNPLEYFLFRHVPVGNKARALVRKYVEG